MSNSVPAVNEDHQQRKILQDCTKKKKKKKAVLYMKMQFLITLMPGYHVHNTFFFKKDINTVA